MKNCERLYNLFCEFPKISNPEAMEKLKWTSRQVIKYKYLLKKRGFIGVDGDEMVILREYSGTDLESINFKQEAYKQLYDICIERAESKDISTSQLIQLIQEIRLVLNQIV